MAEEKTEVTPGEQPAAPKPAEQTPQTPPAETPPATPSPSPDGETVTVTKEEYTQLQRDAARTATAQREADAAKRRAERAEKKAAKSPFATPAANPAETTPPSDDDGRATQNALDEYRKAEQGITKLALEPKYRDVFDADPTLRNLIASNPLGVLPLIAPDALDAEDAVQLVRDELDKRAEELGKKKPAETPKTPETTPPTPPAGAVNLQSADVNEAVEEARKVTDPERAIGGMIKARLPQAK